MNELLDFDLDQNDLVLKKIVQTLNRDDKIEIEIQVDGSKGENYEETPLEIIEPSTSRASNNKRYQIKISQVQKKELVENFLCLKENNSDTLAIHMAIKKFYQKFHPTEFEDHEKYDNWATAKISRSYLRKWTGFYLKDKENSKKLEIEKLELEKLKTEDEIQQEKKIKEMIEKELQDKKLEEKGLTEKRAAEKEIHEKELKIFLEKPMLAIEITPHEKQQIIFRLRLKILNTDCRIFGRLRGLYRQSLSTELKVLST